VSWNEKVLSMTGDRIDRQTFEERLQELAGILARAIIRLRLRAALLSTDPDSQKPSVSVSNCLDGSHETVLSVSTRVDGFGDLLRS